MRGQTQRLDPHLMFAAAEQLSRLSFALAEANTTQDPTERNAHIADATRHLTRLIVHLIGRNEATRLVTTAQTITDTIT